MNKYEIPNYDTKKSTFENIVLWTGFIIAFLSAGIMAALASIQAYDSMHKIHIRDIAAVFTAIIVSTTCVYHAINIKLNITAHNLKLRLDEAKWEEEKQRAIKFHTKDIIREWDKNLANINVAKKAIKEYKNRLPELDELTDEIGITKRIAVIWILNYFEDLAVGLEENVYDETYLRKTYTYLLNRYYAQLETYINYNREKDKSLYKPLEELKNKWAHTR